jgi:hypothetical protein
MIMLQLSHTPQRRASDNYAAAHDVLYAKHIINVYVAVRLYVILAMVISLNEIFFSNNSTHQALFMILNQTESSIATCGAVLLTIVALFDACLSDRRNIVNKYGLDIIANNRHIVYMGLSLCMYGITAAVLSTGVSDTVVHRLMLDGAIAAAIAAFDVYTKIVVLKSTSNNETVSTTSSG